MAPPPNNCVRALVGRGAEPFGTIGQAWLARFLAAHPTETWQVQPPGSQCRAAWLADAAGH